MQGMLHGVRAKVYLIPAMAGNKCIRKKYKSQGVYMFLPLLDSGRSVQLEV